MRLHTFVQRLLLVKFRRRLLCDLVTTGKVAISVRKITESSYCVINFIAIVCRIEISLHYQWLTIRCTSIILAIARRTHTNFIKIFDRNISLCGNTIHREMWIFPFFLYFSIFSLFSKKFHGSRIVYTMFHVFKYLWEYFITYFIYEIIQNFISTATTQQRLLSRWKKSELVCKYFIEYLFS